MFNFIAQHQFWTAVVMYWIFSAAVSSMPDPSNGNSGYLWLFRFLHSVAGNITTVFGSKIPGLKTVVIVVLVPVMFVTNACAVSRYAVHPGALNRTDSVVYDSLLVAETAIDQARVDEQAGRLPIGIKPALNDLINTYNLAREAWLTYRNAISTNTPSDIYFQRLTQNVLDLNNAIHQFEEAK